MLTHKYLFISYTLVKNNGGVLTLACSSNLWWSSCMCRASCSERPRWVFWSWAWPVVRYHVSTCRDTVNMVVLHYCICLVKQEHSQHGMMSDAPTNAWNPVDVNDVNSYLLSDQN